MEPSNNKQWDHDFNEWISKGMPDPVFRPHPDPEHDWNTKQ